MALIPAGEHPTETGAKSAVKIGRRGLAIRSQGMRALFAGETPGRHEWNQQNLKNGFLDRRAGKQVANIALKTGCSL